MGAARLDRATYKRVFWTRYKRAGTEILRASRGRSRIFSLMEWNRPPLVALNSRAAERKNLRKVAGGLVSQIVSEYESCVHRYREEKI